MDKNQLIDLIGKLAGAALAAPKNAENAKEETSGSFLKATEPVVAQNAAATENRKKPASGAINATSERQKPSSDAIIKMINDHNALSRKINSENR